MKTIQNFKLILVLSLVFLINKSYAQWQTVGTEGFSAGSASMVTLAVTGTTLYVAYKDAANSNKVTVMKSVGGTWSVVGAVGISAGSVSSLSLALSPSAIPYIAYADGTNSDLATVKKFDGINWVTVGSEGFTSGSVVDIKIKISGSGIPYVSFTDVANSNKATVMKYDGIAWAVIGVAGFSADIASQPVLAIDALETVYVAYADFLFSNKATVKKFDGTNWVTVGAGAFSTGAVLNLSLAITSNFTPYLAYKDGGNSNKATVKKFDGASWVTVGTEGFSLGTATYESLVTNNNSPYLAYSDGGANNKTTVKNFDGTSWVTIDTVGFSNGVASNLSLAVGSNILYLAYTDASNSSKITVRKFVSCTSPTIPLQPINTTVCAGANTSFTINPSETDVTYQWQYSDGSGWVDCPNTSPYSNVNTQTLTITGATANLNSYQYHCIVYKYCMPTMPTITSIPATLTVNSSPAFLVQPSPATVCLNTNASFTVGLTGAGLTYQWQKNDGSGWMNLSNVAPYSGVNTLSLTITSVTSTLSGYLFRCVVNGTCTPSVTSNQAILNIINPPSITSEPNPSVICEGSNAIFNISASGANLTYQWQKNDGSGWIDLSNVAPYSGVTTTSLTLVTPSSTLSGLNYRCKVSGTCTPVVYSSTVSITIKILPVFVSIPTDSTICEANNVKFSVSANGTSLGYQWQENIGTGWVNLSNVTPYSNVNTAELVISNTPASLHGALYRCLASGACAPAITSNQVTLTVKPLPNESILTNSNMVDTNDNIYIQACGLTTSSTVVQNYIVSYSYNWYKIILLDSIQFTTGSTLNINIPNTNQIEGKYFLKTTHTNGCYIQSKLITINALKIPSASTVSMPPYLCKGDTMNLQADNSENINYSFIWYNNTTPIGNNDTLRLLNYQNSFNLKLETIHDTLVYGHQTSCESALQDISLINPDNVVIPTVLPNSLYCKNSTVNLSPVNNPANNTVKWYENNILIHSGPSFTILILTADKKIKINNINEHNCISLDTTFTIYVDSIKAGFSVSDSIIVLNDVVSFVNHSINGISYVWDFGDSQTSTGTNPSHYYYSINDFTITLIATSQLGCKDTIVKHDFIHVTGIEDNLYARNILIYPNPVKDYLTIENQNPNKKEMIITVYNIIGEILETKKAIGDKIRIDMSGYSRGIYLLNVAGKTVKINKK